MNWEDLDSFTQSYIECALSICRDENDDPIEKNYGYEDFAPDALKQMLPDCFFFKSKVKTYLNNMTNDQLAQAGHEFWLARNDYFDHITGFLDGTFDFSIGLSLKEAAKEFDEIDLYVAGDAAIHICEE